MDNEKSKHRWTGEAGGSVRGLDSRAMSHTGMGSLPSHRRGPTAMLWERLRHASTAHTLQQKNLRRSRRLPAAAEAVQRGARPVVVGDFPPSRDLPHTVWRWWKAGVRPGQHHLKALLDLADDFGLGPVHPKREGRASAGVGAAGPETQMGRIHGCAHGEAAALAATTSPAHRGLVLLRPGPQKECAYKSSNARISASVSLRKRCVQKPTGKRCKRTLSSPVRGP